MSVPESAAELISKESVWEFLKAGGPVMIPIGLCSVAALGFALERYMALTRRRVCPKGFDDALSALEKGDAAAALAACDKTDAPGTRVLAAGLRRRGATMNDIERAMEDQGAKEVERLRGGLRAIHLIVGLAPLLGLFGTVVGIYEAFHVIARSNALGNAQRLASGIETALITTIGGLMVAIPCICVHYHLSTRAKRLLAFLEARLTGVVESLSRPVPIAETVRAS
jgi:biopolymer transport protein ExbB